MDFQRVDRYICSESFNTPLISIIIATFNSELVIANCLQSVISQSYKNIEVIIMDGGSYDKTLDIARSFKDERIKIVSEKDRGIYDAWNKAVDLSSGDWIAFIGSDDVYYHTDAITSLVKGAAISNGAPVVYGRTAHEGPNKEISGFSGSEWYNLKGFKFNYYKCNLPLPIMSAIYSRDFFKDQRFDIKLKIVADADWFLRCFIKWRKENSPYFIDDITPVVRMGYGGVSTDISSQIKTTRESFIVRKKNNISCFNMQLILRY
ncbi:glycosyltransferase, partial [Salmonella enterica]|nr:glycosyltransferase [Salmonella enterica]EBM3291136.1 glycosyltransferase [Salmonella enterica subsp. enterica serovar Adelaide]EDQ8669982.1 glycosyltransferase [Salmonella enterica subsp. enterica serovar Alachua]EDV6707862.1 glycosyltransferase [Salmonella enterica subsp. enterica serovar Widemarsh]EEH1780529.1 glycosyltransferase [Salmonella enterica subsp. enterica]